jgi:AcrR family transcriptional regulator
VPDATRGRIVDAAVELFAARGYGDVAVSDVAAKAGTAKGSVYRHFESKEALFGAAVDSVVAGVVDDLRAAADKAGGHLDPPAAMVALVMSARPGFMLLLELTGGSLRGQAGHRELADRALTCFVDGVGPLLTGPGTPRERAIALIVELARQTMRAVLGGG